MPVEKNVHRGEQLFHPLLFGMVLVGDALWRYHRARGTPAAMPCLHVGEEVPSDWIERLRCQCRVHSLRVGDQHRPVQTDRYASNGFVLPTGTGS